MKFFTAFSLFLFSEFIHADSIITISGNEWKKVCSTETTIDNCRLLLIGFELGARAQAKLSGTEVEYCLPKGEESLEVIFSRFVESNSKYQTMPVHIVLEIFAKHAKCDL
ncbi:hypothetical protein J8M20_14080 [Pseudoalteromonas luteoviolacea]|uniref:hypothetical protein n=1 Tax=Pseudoalteromonas luteoviolacea TaxID=43657 RepID=UPI001B374496|nr:hypothetical protein [Pseudoalteromonas luteoviolacea]MBQ4812481.1 hypothetical protein [Pseudoalteromonas luteoviolacea]